MLAQVIHLFASASPKTLEIWGWRSEMTRRTDDVARAAAVEPRRPGRMARRRRMGRRPTHGGEWRACRRQLWERPCSGLRRRWCQWDRRGTTTSAEKGWTANYGRPTAAVNSGGEGEDIRPPLVPVGVTNRDKRGLLSQLVTPPRTFSLSW
jgi:hypothetical protein